MYIDDYKRWLGAELEDPALTDELKKIEGREDEIKERFAVALKFGTAGLRGILGAGSNRMNIYVVRQATQGLANWVKTQGGSRLVAISYDSRINSDVFARNAACVLAANGIEANLYPRLEPVPALSYAVRALSCGVGICITASHNPAQYNGFKVYGADGCQLTPSGVSRIAAILENHSYFEAIQTGSFDALLRAGSIRWIPEAILNAYLDAVLSLRVRHDDLSGLSIVYTPLNGSGRECVERICRALGIRNFTLVSEQAKPDGHFPTCPYPNPEIREAMALGLSYCERLRPDLLIGTDPDCDRCGVAVPDGKDSYRLLTGNEVGVLLLDFICQARQESGTMPQRPVAVTTIVSTDMADPIAAHYGVELRRTLTGFKFIGEQIGLLESEGHPERFLFGFEESYGYLSGSHVRDKDGVNAVLLLCEMASFYQSRGMTLCDAMDALYVAYGYYCCAQESFTFSGASAMQDMASCMQRLRENPPAEIAVLPVTKITDYLAPDTGLPASDVLEFRLHGGCKLTVRPSGTEPKLKLYLSAKADTQAEAETLLNRLRAACKPLLHF